MADAEKKVMDVAKPGDAKPETGSKPMVIGHKAMAADPSVKIDVSDNSEDKEPVKPTEPKKKLKIEPLGNIKEDLKDKETDEKSVENVASEKEELVKIDTKPAPEEETPKEKESTTETESGTENSEDAPEISADDKKQDKDNAQIEREEKLQELIKSKEYNVSIKQASGTALKTFFLTFITVSLVGALVILVMLDAEIVDLGVELPFDFIK